MDVGIQKKISKIEDLLNTIEIDRELIRGRWPDAKDPEKYQMERVAYNLSQSSFALRELLKALND
jgi:hypothetical protein